jgi:F-type H+/Na+-transporting ATPase subunit alpha
MMNKDRQMPLSEENLESFSEQLLQKTKLAPSKEDFLQRIKQEVQHDVSIYSKIDMRNMVDDLTENSKNLKTRVRFTSVGTVQQIGNGVATVSGLPNVSVDEIVTFPTGVEGMTLNLERKHVDLIMLGSEDGIRGGDLVQATGKQLKIPVGAQLLGRVVDPLGNPIDRDDIIEPSEYRFFARIGPGVIKRTPVKESLFTGTKVIDALFPIGRGQRELILGDRQTGKTTLAVDAIISQQHSGVRCIYVAIGQKKSSTLSVINTLRENDVLSHTIVVLSSPDDQPALRYLAPYTGMTMAEYFLDQGLDVLIVFDDLSKHADSYRELSLLLRRPPGREAYPGDIFYIHSKLLERACKLNPENGGGSITALPIATTQNGNIAAYITTNLISITDGQIVLDANLFNQDQKPAIDIGRSVSRVGGAAQRPAMRQLVGDLKLELSQYKEVEHFTRFGTEVDEATRRQIRKGKRILSILQQKPNQPLSFPMTIVILFALNQGYLEKILPDQIEEYEQALRSYFLQSEKKLLHHIDAEERLTKIISTDIEKALSDFNHNWLMMKGESQ